ARQRPSVPAPLPGRTRGRGVPATVRGGNRGVRQTARQPRATARHHRARRRAVHNQRSVPGGVDDTHHDRSQVHDKGPEGHHMTTTSTDASTEVPNRIEAANPELQGFGRYEYGWSDSDAAGAAAKRGLSEEVVRDISGIKDEPEWMLKRRLKGHKLFDRKPMPTWGADVEIDFDNIKYFVKST